MPDTPVRRLPRRPIIQTLAAGLLASALLLGITGAPAGAATASPAQLASDMISRINKERKERGLTGYQTDVRLNALALERAGRMASKGVLSHTVAGGNVGDALNGRGIQWYGYGEVIGWSGYPWGTQASAHIVRMWMGSSGHRPLLLSKHYNYVGAGLAYRSANGTTWASVVFTESRDQTGSLADNGGLSASGTTITFKWSGKDVKLQTHTAGLRSFDVQHRMDSGAWSTIRNDTGATSLTLKDLSRGHWYGFRVQSADRRGNLSAWTSEKRVWVP